MGWHAGAEAPPSAAPSRQGTGFCAVGEARVDSGREGSSEDGEEDGEKGDDGGNEVERAQGAEGLQRVSGSVSAKKRQKAYSWGESGNEVENARNCEYDSAGQYGMGWSKVNPRGPQRKYPRSGVVLGNGVCIQCSCSTGDDDDRS